MNYNLVIRSVGGCQWISINKIARLLSAGRSIVVHRALDSRTAVDGRRSANCIANRTAINQAVAYTASFEAASSGLCVPLMPLLVGRVDAVQSELVRPASETIHVVRGQARMQLLAIVERVNPCVFTRFVRVLLFEQVLLVLQHLLPLGVAVGEAGGDGERFVAAQVEAGSRPLQALRIVPLVGLYIVVFHRLDLRLLIVSADHIELVLQHTRTERRPAAFHRLGQRPVVRVEVVPFDGVQSRAAIRAAQRKQIAGVEDQRQRVALVLHRLNERPRVVLWVVEFDRVLNVLFETSWG